MAGYNDTRFPESPAGPPFDKAHRNFATNDPACQLWSISLMGLQLWDSVRALDFLASLPEADKKRLAMTGESGGGTQTFILGAVDKRLAAQAPVVMVSHTMQGGCVCENMPGLRVEFSNVEIAAAACPRPQILVASSKDWTKTTLTMEGPAIGHVYELFHEPEKLRYARFDAPHNYNQNSREAVYQWFDRWLLNKPDQPVKELACRKEPDVDLRVFPDGKLPLDAVSQTELIEILIKQHQSRWRALEPKDGPSLQKFKKVAEPAWKHTLQLGWPKESVKSGVKLKMMKADFTSTELQVGRAGEAAEIDVWHFIPARGKPARTRVVLVHPDGTKPYMNGLDEPIGLARDLLDRGFELVVAGDLPKVDTRDQLSLFHTTYNRTQLQETARNLISICKEAENLDSRKARVVLCGSGRAGLWCLPAAPAASAVIADCAQLDASRDENLLAPDLFCPGIRNIGTFTGAAMLAAPHPLLLHNVGPGFDVDALKTIYGALKEPGRFEVEARQLDAAKLGEWIARMK
jgi:hypothetical protein